MGGRLGLVALTVGMSTAMIFLVWYGAAGLKRVPRVLLAIAAFWLFVWLSPQLYYLYYQMIFDDLPWQIVVKSPPGPANIAQLLSFTDRATLSAHGQGLLGWSLMLTALFRRRPR